jgi:tetratricopeptide (TPR) repeat protein
MVAAAICTLLLAGGAFASDECWTATYSQAMNYKAEGNWPEAVQKAKAALKTAKYLRVDRGLRLFKSMRLLGELHRERGNFSEAARLYRRVVGIQEKLFGPVHPNTVESITVLADLYASRRNSREHLGEARRLYDKAKALWEQSGRAEDTGLADALNGLAGLHMIDGEFDQAAYSYGKALEIYRLASKYISRPDLRVAKCQMKLAEAQTKLARHAEARALKQKAFRAFAEAPSELWLQE